jgi:hypothetical protein
MTTAHAVAASAELWAAFAGQSLRGVWIPASEEMGPGTEAADVVLGEVWEAVVV